MWSVWSACCDLDQVCYTDSSGNGQCSQTSALSAALSTPDNDLNPSASAAAYTVITVTPSSDRTTPASATSSSTALPTPTSTESPSNSTKLESNDNGVEHRGKSWNHSRSVSNNCGSRLWHRVLDEKVLVEVVFQHWSFQKIALAARSNKA